MNQRLYRHAAADLGGFSLSKFLGKASGVLNRIAPAAGAIGGALGIQNAGSIVSGSQDVLRRLGFGADGGGGGGPMTPPVVQQQRSEPSKAPIYLAAAAGGLVLLYLMTGRRRR